jgi:hypothetical protein
MNTGGDDDLGLIRDATDEPPPFLGSWNRVYAFVLCYLAAVIFGFWIFERAFTG